MANPAAVHEIGVASEPGATEKATFGRADVQEPGDDVIAIGVDEQEARGAGGNKVAKGYEEGRHRTGSGRPTGRHCMIATLIMRGANTACVTAQR